MENLLNKIDFSPASDHVILAGDMVAKGPDSVGVIDFARQINASCVRGNHDDRVLAAYENEHPSSRIQSFDLAQDSDDEDDDDDDEDGDSSSGREGGKAAARPSTEEIRKKDRKLARKFTEDQVTWMAACPLIIDAGPIPSFGHLLVVHGGLVPGLELDQQDPFHVMNMRTIDLKNNVPSARSKGMGWTKVWNHVQEKLPQEERRVVAYGHDAHSGLQVKKYTFGLDSGCGNNDRLSALVIHPDGQYEIAHVRCHKRDRKRA